MRRVGSPRFGIPSAVAVTLALFPTPSRALDAYTLTFSGRTSASSTSRHG